MFAITYLCHFSNTFNKCHWDVVKHILSYLKGLIDQVIQYEHQDNDVLSLNTDFASDPALLTTCNV